ncbi:MAG: winged helix DNA-binding domain-containing protein [Thermoleophilaceae bacterium]
MPEAERTLTQRELNRALLARQLLLERARLSVPKALERVGGIQAQYAPSMYIGLGSRLEGFDCQQLTGALERRAVVQGTLLRATIHVVSAGDWWRFAAAVRGERRERWLRYQRGEPTAGEMAAAAKRVRPRLADGSLPRAELQELVGKGSRGTNGIGLWLDLVRIPPSGTWERRRADLYADAERWLGPAPEISEADARVELVRSYLRGFGPASRAEIADWAGLGIGHVAPALERLQLRRFRAEDGEELLDLPRAPLPDPETPAPPRFLPTWDATLLAHARRTQILPERHRPRVFHTKVPQSVATFLVDGAVAGTWRYDKDRVRLEPFERLTRATRNALDEEAERLAELHR